MVAWGDVETLREGIGQVRSAGADHVAIIPVAADGDTTDVPVLEALAG
jgi:hypothetical protein